MIKCNTSTHTQVHYSHDTYWTTRHFHITPTYMLINTSMQSHTTEALAHTWFDYVCVYVLIHAYAHAHARARYVLIHAYAHAHARARVTHTHTTCMSVIAFSSTGSYSS